MKTSLAASLLFHPATCSLGRGGESLKQIRERQSVACGCCSSPCWLVSFYLLFLQGAEKRPAQLFAGVMGCWGFLCK